MWPTLPRRRPARLLGTITRPDFEEGGGTLTSLGAGQYQYTLKAQAPAGFDPTVTTTVAVDGSRDLRHSIWAPTTPETPSISFLMARRLR